MSLIIDVVEGSENALTGPTDRAGLNSPKDERMRPEFDETGFNSAVARLIDELDLQ